MFISEKTYITKDKRMFDLIVENHSLLLCLQHFEIDFAVGGKTVEELCSENNIDPEAFIIVANLYNGFLPEERSLNTITNIHSVLLFLKKSHSYYVRDKYPELKYYLEKLKNNHNSKDHQLIERFFNDYFEEVMEHLKYEDEVAFPYFKNIQNPDGKLNKYSFSVNEYRNHHTDIETKLTDLKSLFLKHIQLESELSFKRKFLTTLFELEFDLKIHSYIEERVLIPIIERFEAELNG
jgi:regulator of cell morphogenesis and NO signaling